MIDKNVNLCACAVVLSACAGSHAQINKLAFEIYTYTRRISGLWLLFLHAYGCLLDILCYEM